MMKAMDSAIKKIAAVQAMAALGVGLAAGLAAGGLALASALAGGFAVALPTAYLAIRGGRLLRENRPNRVGQAAGIAAIKFGLTILLLGAVVRFGGEWLMPTAFVVGVASAILGYFASAAVISAKAGE